MRLDWIFWWLTEDCSMLVAMGTWGRRGGKFMEIRRWDGVMCVSVCVCVCVGVNGDKLAGESGDADLLIKIDVLPFCFKCN